MNDHKLRGDLITTRKRLIVSLAESESSEAEETKPRSETLNDVVVSEALKSQSLDSPIPIGADHLRLFVQHLSKESKFISIHWLDFKEGHSSIFRNFLNLINLVRHSASSKCIYAIRFGESSNSWFCVACEKSSQIAYCFDPYLGLRDDERMYLQRYWMENLKFQLRVESLKSSLCDFPRDYAQIVLAHFVWKLHERNEIAWSIEFFHVLNLAAEFQKQRQFYEKKFEDKSAFFGAPKAVEYTGVRYVSWPDSKFEKVKLDSGDTKYFVKVYDENWSRTVPVGLELVDPSRVEMTDWRLIPKMYSVAYLHAVFIIDPFILFDQEWKVFLKDFHQYLQERNTSYKFISYLWFSRSAMFFIYYYANPRTVHLDRDNSQIARDILEEIFRRPRLYDCTFMPHVFKDMKALVSDYDSHRPPLRLEAIKKNMVRDMENDLKFWRRETTITPPYQADKVEIWSKNLKAFPERQPLPKFLQELHERRETEKKLHTSRPCNGWKEKYCDTLSCNELH